MFYFQNGQDSLTSRPTTKNAYKHILAQYIHPSIHSLTHPSKGDLNDRGQNRIRDHLTVSQVKGL